MVSATGSAIASAVALLCVIIVSANAFGIPDQYCPVFPYSQPKNVWPDTNTEYCSSSNLGLARLYDVVGDQAGCVAWGTAPHGGNYTLAFAQSACANLALLHDAVFFWGKCVSPIYGTAYEIDTTWNPECAHCSTFSVADFRYLPFATTPAPTTLDPTATPGPTEPWENKKRNGGALPGAKHEKRGKPTPAPTTTAASTTAAPGPDRLGLCTVRTAQAILDSGECLYNPCIRDSAGYIGDIPHEWCFEPAPNSHEDWYRYESLNRFINWFRNEDANVVDIAGFIEKYGRTSQTGDYTAIALQMRQFVVRYERRMNFNVWCSSECDKACNIYNDEQL